MRYLLLLFASTVSALKFTATKSNLGVANSASKPSTFPHAKVNAVVSEDNDLNLQTVNDVIYLANMTLGNTSYTVQLDTGSSDLWIKGATSPIPNTDQSPTTCNLTYGIGWAFGHISYASVQFAGITVDKQAFIDAASVDNPALRYGADGILGLGFTTLSTIDATVNGTGSSSGRSLLYNLFQQNPSQPNYMSFAFQRSSQPGDDIEGSFGIGEVDPEHKAVLDSPAIPTWPVVRPKRWNVLLETVLIGSKQVSVTTTVANAPSNRAVVLLDSGTSYTYAPKSIVDEIYAPIPGASFDATRGQWSVPCDAEIDMALQFGGKVFPVHPLDVIPMSKQNQCYGSFVPGSVAVGAGEFDWLIGDNFLRSVYSVYDFGDFDSNNQMGNPYVKLLSLVDPNQASAEFVALRGGTAKTNITYNAADDGGSNSSTTITVSADVANALTKMGTLFPVMLAIMGLNALVVIIAIFVAIFYLCRRRKRRSGGPKIALPRTPMGRMSPMPMATRNSYVAGTDEPLAKEPHTYEPVSMAITEDTFVPSSPGFRQFDGKPGDRPKSMATLPSQSKLYQQIGSEDALFSPPTPGFAKGARPTSVASLPIASATSHPPEDQPFTAPPIISLRDMDDKASVHSGPSPNADQVSVHSQHSRHSLVGEAASIHSRQSRIIEAPQVGENQQPLTSPDNTLVDVTPPSSKEPEVRPKSILVNSSQTSLHTDDNSGNTPPSTAFYSPTSQSSITPAQSPLQSAGSGPSDSGLARPPVPPAFRPRSHLRPSPMATGDRPMSVGILPSQQFMPPSPPVPRVGSSLRPGGANLQAGMRPTSAAFASHYPPPQEEDITTFEPPAPPFRRLNSSNGSDRPASMA